MAGFTLFVFVLFSMLNKRNHILFSISKLIYLTLFLFAASCSGKNSNSKDNKPTYISNPFMSPEGAKVPDSIAKTGRILFNSNCKMCHNDSVRLAAPGLDVLNTLTPRAIFAAIKNGKMRTQAEKLTDEQRKAIASWITNRVFEDNDLPKEAYTSFSISNSDNTFFDQSGWGGNLEGTGYRTAEQAGIDISSVNSLQLKWAFAFPGATQVRSKPAITGEWLITGSEFGDVYTINIKSGKAGWRFVADAAIRGAIQVTRTANSLTAWFADYSTNVYAIDIKTGKLIWKKRAGIHAQSSVTGSVAVFNNIIYVPLSSTEVISALNPDYACCTASGEVVALDAETGNIIWRYRVVKDEAKVSGKKKNGKLFYGPSGAPVWSSPTIDAKRNLLYIGTGENYTSPATNTSDAILALDLKTGKLVWSYQATKNDTWNLGCLDVNANCPDKEGPDLDFGMAPLLVKKPDGKDILVVGQKSGVVHALSPDDGKILWQTRIGKGGQAGGIHWGMAADGKYVYAANADNIRDLDMRDTARKASPGIFALELESGKIIWEAATPPCSDRKGCFQSNSAAPTVVPGIVFAGALDGHIRAYSAIDGKIIWDFDTVKEYTTVNGVKGKGGALDGSAPVAANGMLFVNSGYGLFGQIPGNVLLAFEVRK
jgi:polyvinyl alcohol dehydrogenase (cytochrome)